MPCYFNDGGAFSGNSVFSFHEISGKIWNEQKFKHLTGTNHVFEFKVDEGRILSFFFFGRRLILTHGFSKKSAKTPKGEIERAENYKKDFEEGEKWTHGN